MSAAVLEPKLSSTVLTNTWATTILLGGVLIASVMLPLPAADGKILGLPDVCLFYDFTGLPCPGCGLTRSFVCFAHGRIAEAFGWHLFGPPLWLLFALLFVRSLFTIKLKRDVFPVRSSLVNKAALVGVVAFVVFGATRIAWLLITHRHF
jgi:hypothetical protein